MSDTQNIPTAAEKKLSPKQLQAITLLASGKTIDATAVVVGVGEKSIDNWKKIPEFAAALRQAENDIYDESLHLLKKAARAAITCLVRNMSEKTSAYVQVQAASKLLDYGMEIHKITALEEQVRELQAIIKDRTVT